MDRSIGHRNARRRASSLPIYAGCLPDALRVLISRIKNPVGGPVQVEMGGVRSYMHGGVPEWTKGADCKSAIRGFESHRRLSVNML